MGGALATLALAAVSADAVDPSFREGVAAGEVTSGSALLWTRAPRPGTVVLTVSTRTGVPVGRFVVPAASGRDRTAPTPESYGIWEIVTGPVATNTFAKEIDGFLGQKGAGTAIGALFFKPQPPNGVGMRCAALDTYSYAQVTVTATRLTVALKDARGRPVREATGSECPPLVLAAR